jgi:uncharacterized protein YdaU (DUF1376 family)
MKKIRRIDLSPSEFNDGTVGLKAEDIGVYIVILCRIADNAGAIDKYDYRVLHHFKNQNPKIKKIIDKLIELEKLIEINGKVTNNRIEYEIKQTQKRIENAQENGKKGGRRKAEIVINHTLNKPNGLLNKKLTTNDQLLTNNYEEDFNVFWEKYDKKMHKKKTKDLYLKTRKLGVTQDNLLQGIKTLYQGIAEDKQNGFNRNPPSPYQWLKDERWEDEVKQVKSEILIKNPDAEWRKNLQWYRDKNYWNANWGAKPETERCEAPKHLLREFGFEPSSQISEKKVKNISKAKAQAPADVE